MFNHPGGQISSGFQLTVTGPEAQYVTTDGSDPRAVGAAPPGSTIEAHLDLRVETTGRSFVYTQTTRADERGRFELVLPYSTGQPPSSSVVGSDGPYQLRAFSASAPVGGVFHLDLSDAQVSTGEQVDLEAHARSDSPATP